MSAKYLVKGSGVLFSLLLPVFSVWLVCYCIGHNFVRLTGIATGFYAFSQALAFSTFCRKMPYRIAVAAAAFLIVGMCIWVWQFLIFLLAFIFLGAVSVNIIPRNWNKWAWLMLPYIAIRAAIVYLSFDAGWTSVFVGEFSKHAYIPLLCFTYWQISIILIFDLIVYCIIKVFLRNKDLVVLSS